MTSRQRHQNIANEFKKLNDILDTMKDDYLEQISSIINKAIKRYKDKTFWKQSCEKIINIFYECLTETYLKTTIRLQEIYGDISDDIPNLEDFIYQDDNKTLSERIEGYWDEAKDLLQSDYTDKSKISLYLLNMYDRILTTEISNIKTGVKKVKKPKIDNLGCIEVIEITSGQCCDNGGLYLVEDDPELPPYHPCCECDWWFDTYDPEDAYDYEELQEAGWEDEDE